ncbi:MAG TPA: MiaB/RimO family radical SAM methylthiotransferase, partial [Anaerolineales bacterium]|nr:MiaB/RimO family radical SAM methylthiotransferase [Anaerolineales bacterium]
RVVSNADKDRLVPQVLGLLEEVFDLEPVAREPLPGARLRTRAYIKVQDGCDNRCTFCITTVVRGAGRSRPLGDVLADIDSAVEGGAQEVVLTGVHLGSWGQDGGDEAADAGLRIRDLVAAVLRETGAPRVRLSSLEPWDLDADFFGLWAEDPRLCRHLHLPLQSGCDRTLRRMARKTSQKSFRGLVRDARRACPEIAITTDLIAGFPGETEDEFEKTLAFVEEMAFAGAHVFPYSERPGTAAAAMPDPVDHPVRKRRAADLRRIVSRSARRYRERFAGQTLAALWESAAALGPDGWHMSGLTDNYLRVSALAPRDLWNELTPVVLEEVTEEGMNGRMGE